MKLLKLSVLVMAIVGQASAKRGESGSRSTNYGSSSVNYGAGGRLSTAFGGGSSVNYGGDSSFTSSEISRTASSRGSSGGYGQNEVPRPYNFDYQSADQQGNSHYHREEADGSGAVRGSYGFIDVQGLYRVVDYTADASGFRASIQTNEPGTDGKESPADVQMTVEQPPFGIQESYTPLGGPGGSTRPGYGAGAGGYGCSGSSDSKCYEATDDGTYEEDDEIKPQN